MSRFVSGKENEREGLGMKRLISDMKILQTPKTEDFLLSEGNKVLRTSGDARSVVDMAYKSRLSLRILGQSFDPDQAL